MVGKFLTALFCASLSTSVFAFDSIFNANVDETRYEQLEALYAAGHIPSPDLLAATQAFEGEAVRPAAPNSILFERSVFVVEVSPVFGTKRWSGGQSGSNQGQVATAEALTARVNNEIALNSIEPIIVDELSQAWLEHYHGTNQRPATNLYYRQFDTQDGRSLLIAKYVCADNRGCPWMGLRYANGQVMEGFYNNITVPTPTIP